MGSLDVLEELEEENTYDALPPSWRAFTRFTRLANHNARLRKTPPLPRHKGHANAPEVIHPVRPVDPSEGVSDWLMINDV